MHSRIDEAKAILAANDRGGYTVPTEGSILSSGTGIRPSWPWVLRSMTSTRAYRELERLVEGQWPDGMIPHIVFHQPSDTYFPGPDVWRTRHTVPTSGITQPPVFAMALRRFVRPRQETETARGSCRCTKRP